MLKTRLITGILLIASILGAIFLLPGQYFPLIAGVLGLGMMMEWLALIGFKHLLGRILLLDLFIVLEFFFYWFLPELVSLFWVPLVFWFLMIPVLWRTQLRQAYPKLSKIFLIVAGFFILLMFFAGLLELRAGPRGEYLVLMAFLLVWCSDSFAYVAGHLFGRHKLIPQVSPGKTWEGLIGGLVLTLPLIAWYSNATLTLSWPPLSFYLAVSYLIVMGVVGDLFESLIKRIHQVKDSGKILPGHGGLLDRFDSLIALAPVMALFYLQGYL